jgi:homoserine/homoserine lactone efflux protein
MLSFDQLLLFFTLTCFLSASPGPVMLSCMTNGGHYGMGKAFYGMAGASLGNLLLVGCSAVGLGILLTEAEGVFTLIKWLGAGYLIVMGVQLWMKPVGKSLNGEMRFTSSAQKLFWQSVGIAVSNPKAIIYFSALFPQFINPEQALLPQFALLTVIFLSLDLVWMTIYAKSGSYIVSWLKSPEHHRLFNRLSASALIAAGILLGLTKN